MLIAEKTSVIIRSENQGEKEGLIWIALHEAEKETS